MDEENTVTCPICKKVLNLYDTEAMRAHMYADNEHKNRLKKSKETAKKDIEIIIEAISLNEKIPN